MYDFVVILLGYWFVLACIPYQNDVLLYCLVVLELKIQVDNERLGHNSYKMPALKRNVLHRSTKVY